MRFEWANHAAAALGCEFEELNTATFKHHLRQIIEQVTSRPRPRGLEEEEASPGTALSPLWVAQCPLPRRWARTAFFHLLTRSALTPYSVPVPGAGQQPGPN